MENYEQVARRAAARYGLNPNVFVRQIRAESDFNPRASSPAGARGIAQIMPSTARSWGVNPDDPVAALNAAAKNMAAYVKKYGSYRNALVAYNAGPGRVGKPLYGETANYIARILPNGEPTDGLGPGRPGARTQTAPRGGARPSVATAGSSDLQAQARRQAAAQWLLSSSKSVADLQNRVAQAEASVPAQAQPTTVQPRGRTTVRRVESNALHPGSPVPHQGPRASTHPTAGLPGYPAYDYMARAGTPAVAPVSGKVIKVSGSDPKNGPPNGPHGPFGLSVYIRGDDGRTYYLTHMGSRTVKVGQRVGQGQRIGSVGNYAKWGGADHIHMGVSGR